MSDRDETPVGIIEPEKINPVLVNAGDLRNAPGQSTKIEQIGSNDFILSKNSSDNRTQNIKLNGSHLENTSTISSAGVPFPESKIRKLKHK